MKLAPGHPPAAPLQATPGSTDRDGDVAIIWVDNPPLNLLSEAVREHLVRSLRQADADPSIRGMVIACRGDTFIVGADISRFSGGAHEVNEGNDFLAALQDCGKPVVAALHGNVYGGGLELALAGDYRVAVPSARFALPEVHLGLLPGGGGTQRLPRLIGARHALDWMLGGQPVTAAEALAVGAIDRIVEAGQLLPAAIAQARSAPGRRRASDMQAPTDPSDGATWLRARERAANSPYGRHATARIVDCVEAAVTRSYDEGVRVEAAAFRACLAHWEGPALQHVFFAERAARKVPGAASTTARQQAGPLRTIVGGPGSMPLPGQAALELRFAGDPATADFCEVVPVPGDAAADAAVSGMGVLRRMSVTGIVVRDPSVFIVERLRSALLEALRSQLDQGRPAAHVLRALRSFGWTPPASWGGDDAAAATSLKADDGADDEADRAVLDALILPVVAACRRLLADEVVHRASDLDLACIHGLGFPRYRGGPLYWADRGHAHHLQR